MDITQEEYLAYEECRASGVTNMYDTAVVSRETGLTRDQVRTIITNYDMYAGMWGRIEDEQPDDDEVPDDLIIMD